MPLPSGSDVLKQVNDAISGSDVKQLLLALRSNDVDVNERDVSHDLTTVVMKICHMKVELDSSHPIFMTLQDLNFDPDMADAHGRTALMHACIGGKFSMFSFLLALKANVRLTDKDGNSVLVYAIKSGSTRILEALLQEDAVMELVQMKNNMGLLPVDIARQGHSSQILNILEELDQQNHHRRKRSKRRNFSLSPTKPITTRSPSRRPQALAGTPRRQQALEASPRLIDRYDGGEMKSDGGLKDLGWVKNSHQAESSVPNDGKYHRFGDNSAIVGENATPRRDEVSKREVLGENGFLPKVKTTNQSEKRKESFKCRRDSISLPDLRDMHRNLICSRDVAPGSADRPRVGVFGSRDTDPVITSTRERSSKENSFLTELPNLRDKLTKCRDVPRPGRSNSKHRGSDAQHRSLIA